MASPPPDAVKAIQSFIPDWKQSPATILAALNAPAIDNPAKAADIPKPYTAPSLLTLLSISSQINLKTVPLAVQLLDDIHAQRTARVQEWAVYLANAGVITTSERDAVLADLAATVPDPAHAAQLSWAEVNLGRPADLDDVITSKP